MKKVRYVVLFLIGFCMYITLEVLFRGYSFLLMGLSGAVAVLIIDQLNKKIPWNVDLLIKGILGSVIITFIEMTVGLLDKYILHMNMWDYSCLWLDFQGVICPLFSFIWIFISIGTLLIIDAIDYYVFNDFTEPPYYKLFGKVIFRFNEIK